MSKPQTWQEIEGLLTARRAALNKEIAAYPGPITGCDAQFNYLLERRIGLNAELARISELSKDTKLKTLARFIEACPFLTCERGKQ